MSSQAPIKIAIIGAGIAGISLAIALSKHAPSIRLTIYESRPAFSEIAAGVGFGPNAVRAMSLIDAGIKEAYDAVRAGNGNLEKGTVWGTLIFGEGEKAGETIADIESLDGFVYYAASRSAFLDELVKLIPSSVEVEFGKKVVDIRELGNGMKVTFDGGEELDFDAVIGCDGIRSACRKSMLDGYEATYSGKYAYRKVIPMAKALAVVGREAENRTFYVGKGRHIVMFPIKNGELLNFVVFKDAEGKSWTERQWVLPSTRDELLEDFKGWDQKYIDLLKLIEDPDKWALFDHPPAPTYSKGNFCLVGDAAHATTPHSGAGAGFAIEDVHLLSGLLIPDLIKSSSDIKYAFQAYDAIRRPRSQELVTRSRNQGMQLEYQTGILSEEELIAEVERNMEWVWGADLHKMLVEARSLVSVFRETMK